MDYQVPLAALLVVFIPAEGFLILYYTPPPSNDSKINPLVVQLAKWLRVAGMVRPPERKIQISLLTGSGLWPFIRHPLPV